MNLKLRLPSIILLLFLLVSSCQMLEEADNIQPDPKATGAKTQIISAKDDPKLKAALSEALAKKKKVNARSGNSLANFNRERVIKVRQQDNTYTYTIRDTTTEAGVALRVLVLKEKGNGYLGFVFEYSPDSPAQGGFDLKNFSGTLSRYDLEGLLLSKIKLRDGKPQRASSANARTVAVNSCLYEIRVTYSCPNSGSDAYTSTATGITYDTSCDSPIANVSFVYGECPSWPDDGGGISGGTPIGDTGGGGTTSGGGSGSTDPNHIPDPVYPDKDPPLLEEIGIEEEEPSEEQIYTAVAAEGADEMVAAGTDWDEVFKDVLPQDKPTFDAFFAAFPKDSVNKQMPSDKVFELVGGNVLALSILNGWTNACAVRTSRALNYSGVVIPNIPNYTYQGLDGKFYFASAQVLYVWMIKTFGSPTVSTNQANTGSDGAGFLNAVNQRKGMYIMIPKYPGKDYYRATGHSDIYDGAKFNGAGEFNPKGGLFSANLWVLN